MYKKGKENELRDKGMLDPELDEGKNINFCIFNFGHFWNFLSACLLTGVEMEAILDSENFLLNEDPELEQETEELLQWAEDLNFDKYMDDWFFKSTVFVNFDSNTINPNM